MSSSLKEYLKKYQSTTDSQTKKKKKKKEKKPASNPFSNVLVVDEDPVWQKPIIDEEEESAEDEAPQIDEDIEVKRMKRLEAIRSRKPYNGISEDGSGWVSISDQPNSSYNANGDSDLSPPRNRPPRYDTPSPGREQKLDDSRDIDLSPPRQHHQRRLDTPSPEPDGDLSPPRKRSVEDLSPPRRNRNLSSEADDDLSPPRRRKKPSLIKETRNTGLLSAEEIRKENDRKRKDEISRFASMDASVSGKGAEAIFRDKEGRRMKKEDLQKAHKEEKPKEKKLEWGKGLAQKREAEARVKELELEKDKPFARSRDDPDLDKMLKERVRFGDPMAHLVKNKNSEMLLEDLGDDEKMKESGFLIPQTIPSHSWIKRGIDFPPNRYNIRPGRHWDGVDRSTGYEKELFKRQNEKRATETEAYMWSVADM